jgi:hypothetical protein
MESHEEGKTTSEETIGSTEDSDDARGLARESKNTESKIQDFRFKCMVRPHQFSF